ncbi:glycosyltransferase family 4 protein [Serratia sp. TSA_198.1]|jgi:glycosyltransferase involved in cell wall biosynthesis|uniref:glycosyltransferase family 4 protein n=1 Tax=Serratia TaxID=613 RepID=UPI0007A047F8|nr:glycosyltransferase family 4 protein [Serratia plymuthica]KYQ95118.1 hypothetical protein AWY96_17140 [Serratia plymuthica]
MKILIVNTIYSPFKVGGAEVSVQLLAEELVKIGHSVRVVTLHDEKNRKSATINGVDVCYLPLKNLYWPFDSNANRQSSLKKLLWHIIDNYNPVMAKLFAKELDDFKPDVVHTNNVCGFSVAIWKEVSKRSIKLIHTSRDYYLLHPSSTLYAKNENINTNALSVRIWSFLKRHASKHVDVYVGISDFIKTFHVDNGFFSKSQSRYIYNAVNKPIYEANKFNATHFGFIGRLTKDKGFDDYCAFARKNPDALYYAAGRFANDHEGVELKELAEKSSVKLLGFVSVESFLSQIDVAFLPVKWREPFGRVIVECVLAKKIVMTNAVGGITELGKLLPNVYFIEETTEDVMTDIPNEITDEHIAMFSQRRITTEYLSAYLSSTVTDN